jgi:hypothetical protein
MTKKDDLPPGAVMAKGTATGKGRAKAGGIAAAFAVGYTSAKALRKVRAKDPELAKRLPMIQALEKLLGEGRTFGGKVTAAYNAVRRVRGPRPAEAPYEYNTFRNQLKKRRPDCATPKEALIALEREYHDK